MISTLYITKKIHCMQECTLSFSLSRCIDLRQQLCFVENKLALHLSAAHSSIQVVVQYIEPQGRIFAHIYYILSIDSFPTIVSYFNYLLPYYFHSQGKTKFFFYQLHVLYLMPNIMLYLFTAHGCTLVAQYNHIIYSSNI